MTTLQTLITDVNSTVRSLLCVDIDVAFDVSETYAACIYAEP